MLEPKSTDYHKGISTVVIIILALIVVIVGISGVYFVLNGTSQTENTNATSNGSSSPLIVYVADAYVQEATALESNFSSSTGILTAPPKSAGSLALAQQIAQGNPVSVFISVSRLAVETQYLHNESSGWAIAFAGDQMSIAYSRASLKISTASDVINSYDTAISTNTTEDWYNFFNNLTSGSVKVGISNPNTDPAGYRAWLVLEAAGYVYANNTSYFVNRLLNNQGNVTAASATTLVAPLQAGQIQFLFIYKSASVILNLNSIYLSDGVNLGISSYASFYSKFNYTISTGPVSGSPIILWITVPKHSTDPLDSVTFVVWIIQHSSALSKFGLTVLAPAKLYNSTSVPAPISLLISQDLLAYSGSLP